MVAVQFGIAPEVSRPVDVITSWQPLPLKGNPRRTGPTTGVSQVVANSLREDNGYLVAYNIDFASSPILLKAIRAIA